MVSYDVVESVNRAKRLKACAPIQLHGVFDYRSQRNVHDYVLRQSGTYIRQPRSVIYVNRDAHWTLEVFYTSFAPAEHYWENPENDQN